MQQLNFPSYNFRFKNSENKVAIFDEIRNVEKLLKINDLKKRYDIVVFNPDGSIRILVECKAPEITIAQNTFDQIARYNLTLKAQFLMVTNGHNHYFCQMDFENEKYIFLKELPHFETQ